MNDTLKRHEVRSAEIEFGDRGLRMDEDVVPAQVANEDLDETGPSTRTIPAAREVFREPDTPSPDEAERVRQFILALDEDKKRQKQDDELRIPANAPVRPKTADEIAAEFAAFEANRQRQHRRRGDALGMQRHSASMPYLTILEREILEWAEERGMSIATVRMHTHALTEALRNRGKKGQNGTEVIMHDEVERMVNNLYRKLHHLGI